MSGEEHFNLGGTLGEQPASSKLNMSPNAQSGTSLFPSSSVQEKAPEKDVMNVINALADDGSQSKYLAGHISKKVMDDTFLVNEDMKVPDSSLAINCDAHNRPAVFFSQKQNAWRCFLCMMNQEGLIYVDKQYKHDMEDYENIKSTTFKVICENSPSMTLVKDWKE